MRIDPRIAALRSDKALQRRAQASMDQAVRDWRERPSVSRILDELDRYGAGGSLDEMVELPSLVTSLPKAKDFVDRWSDGVSACLAAEPLAQVPFRHSHSRGFSTMRIASSGTASLSLLAYEPQGNGSEPESASFTDCEQREIVLSGEAKGSSYRLLDGHRIANRSHVWIPGDRLSHCGPAEARLVIRVPDHLSMLQLVRSAQDPAPVRQYSLTDGSLIHQASGDKRTSQTEMALAVLGAMGRDDAAPVLGQIANSGPSHLRWEALRQLLSLDAKAGADKLCDIADKPGDCLQASAQSLSIQLAASHPELFENEFS